MSTRDSLGQDWISKNCLIQSSSLDVLSRGDFGVYINLLGSSSLEKEPTHFVVSRINAGGFLVENIFSS